MVIKADGKGYYLRGLMEGPPPVKRRRMMGPSLEDLVREDVKEVEEVVIGPPVPVDLEAEREAAEAARDEEAELDQQWEAVMARSQDTGLPKSTGKREEWMMALPEPSRRLKAS
jgi:hypothetical protein